MTLTLSDFCYFRKRKYMKIGRKWAPAYRRSINEMLENPQNCLLILYCMCRANCIGNSYNVMIISLLDGIRNGLPDDAHELMGFNKAAIIDKMIAV